MLQNFAEEEQNSKKEKINIEKVNCHSTVDLFMLH